MARSAVVDSSRISAFPDFANLPADELAELAGSMTELDVGAGANIITVDDYGTAIYFVEEGEADVLDEDGGANEFVGPGDVVGEIGLFLIG